MMKINSLTLFRVIIPFYLRCIKVSRKTFSYYGRQLDQENGNANGAPILDKGQNYKCWSEVFSLQFEKLKLQAKAGKPSLFDYYGATEPAEFFAVASEVFFEQASKFHSEYPMLYRQLKQYYQVDPLHW